MWCMGKPEVYSQRRSPIPKVDLAERHERIREAAMKTVGAIHGDDPRRAENVRSRVRSQLARL
jgi:hypothetical protein